MLTYEINQNDLIYYFKGNIARKRFYGFNNGRELFKKIKYGEMRLEEAKKTAECVYCFSSNKRPWRLLNFGTLRC